VPFFETEEGYICKTHHGKACVLTTPKSYHQASSTAEDVFVMSISPATSMAPSKLLTKAPAEALLRV